MSNPHASEKLIEVFEGDAPLLMSIPHAGTFLPDSIAGGLIDSNAALDDTDWWIDKVYAFASALGATIVKTSVSRVVIDVNRDPSGASLYPGQATTSLCPTVRFDGTPLYRTGAQPSADDIAKRMDRYYWPYHTAIKHQIDRLRQHHATIIVYDCHSIRSHVARLFDGELPALNLGFNSGKSCHIALQDLLKQCCAASGFSYVADGRFKGGWITRHYGRPVEGVHAVQMEIAQRTYMQEPNGVYDVQRAQPLIATLHDLLSAAIAWANDQKDRP